MQSTELTSVDLYYVARELAQFAGAKVEKVFQSNTHKRDLFFICYLKDAPKLHLRFLLPGLICTPKEKPAYPQLPPGFAMFLRKRLGGTRLVSAQQRGFDRIIEMGFASKTEEFTLVVEFLFPGNMLLLDKEGRIINLLENQQYKDRTLRARQPYIAPPPAFNIVAATDAELSDRITTSTKDSIVTTLAVNCGLGGLYAEEACLRAGIAKRRNDLSHAEVGKIVTALRDILNQSILAHTDGQRAYPFRLQSKELRSCEDSSFLSALSLFTSDEPLLGKLEQKQRDRAMPQTKLQAIIGAQRAQITRFEQDMETEQRKAETIYLQYQLLQEIMTAAKEARERKQDVTTALRKFPQVKSYKDATGEIELDIEENS